MHNISSLRILPLVNEVTLYPVPRVCLVGTVATPHLFLLAVYRRHAKTCSLQTSVIPACPPACGICCRTIGRPDTRQIQPFCRTDAEATSPSDSSWAMRCLVMAGLSSRTMMSRPDAIGAHFRLIKSRCMSVAPGGEHLKTGLAPANESSRRPATAHSSIGRGPPPVADPPHDLTGLTPASPAHNCA